MDAFISALLLAVIQGITEWFPVSSSGHLVVFSYLLGYPNTVLFDVAVHFGTLMAVFVYFGKDIVDILEDLLRGRWKSPRARMGFLLILASVPGAVIGYLFKGLIEAAFSSLLIVALGFAITGVTLLIGSLDLVARKKTISRMDAFLIGCAQAVAILPGVSRSGSTISTGLLRGLNEKEAVRFSFLMAIPIIFGAGILEIGNQTLPSSFIWATLVAFIVGLATIHVLLKFVLRTKKNLRWFGIYALVLAATILAYLFLAH